MSFGSEVLADALYDALLVGDSFDAPSVNINDAAFTPPSVTDNALYQKITELTNADLTTRTVNGSGAYDAIMESQSVHLRAEYTAGRITGAEYTKAYIALAQNAVSVGVQFLLGKEQTYWTSINAQMQALTARVNLETAKAQLGIALADVKNRKVSFALNKAKLANEDAQYGINKYNIETTLPAQTLLLAEQKKLLAEQVETARAQTMNTRTDGVTAVTGSVGKQKDLYSQQITSYQRSSELNATKVFTDAWAVNLSISEPGTIPTNFSDASLDSLLTGLKTKNGL